MHTTNPQHRQPTPNTTNTPHTHNQPPTTPTTNPQPTPNTPPPPRRHSFIHSQVHGFPKVMGVLTHLDTFRDAARLKKAKKTLRQRFWAEVYPGAKLFYLSGLRNGKYLKREVRRMRARNVHACTQADTYAHAHAHAPHTQAHGKHAHAQVLNLARFISVMKFRPLSWRQAHPFLIADRFEARVCRLFCVFVCVVL